MRRGMKISIAMLLCFPLIAAGYVMLAGDDTGLATVHDAIEVQFDEVSHINGDDLSTLRQEGIVLFDVREPPEFAVSHLKGAIRIDPEMSAQDFIGKFSDVSKGKIAVFYCSVGQRSSSLADRVQGAMISSGAKAAYNLEGGIFKWHNEGRPLYTRVATPTDYVHPYNSAWARLVKAQHHIRY